MILVADSGSTRTNWIVIENQTIHSTFDTIGFNPYFTNRKEIKAELSSNFPKSINQNRIGKIHFYGSGCSSDKMNRIIYNGLHSFFQNSIIHVEHDLLAAARALFQNESGIAVILGTGANTCLYNGSEITRNITSLGFILGDEGGGDYLGKLFIQAYLNKELPSEIEDKFSKEFKLSANDILHAVYKKPNPNRFIASFTKFILTHSETPIISEIITKSFHDLFTKHISKYEDYCNAKIRVTGSIAFYFKNYLHIAAKNFNAKIDLIEKEPIQLLAKYHLNNSES
jgi:N-acetylglucosamine kinase-like BadF-type ATPase